VVVTTAAAAWPGWTPALVFRNLFAFAGNMFQVYGVLVWGWDMFQILMLYWMETGIIGFWALLRLAVLPQGMLGDMTLNGRVVTATNRDLTADSRTGRFRADLFYRLNVFPIELPPLRERRDDIETLAEHFMRRMARKLGKPLDAIESETLHALKAYSWPGNIRDLQNTIERAAVLAPGPILRVDWNLGRDQGAGAGSNGSASPAQSGLALEQPAAEPQSMQAVERSHMIAILKKTRGVIEGPNGAARLLNMNASTTRFRMKKLGITRADYSADGNS